MRAIREHPNDPDIYYNVGVLYQKMAITMFEPARSRFVEESNKDEWDKVVMNSISVVDVPLLKINNLK